MPRRLVHSLLLLLIATASDVFPKPPAPSPDLDRIWRGDFTTPRPLSQIHVVDWNIDRGTGLSAINAALEREKPDLCLLQEVDLDTRRTKDRNVAEEIAKTLKLNYVFAAEFQELNQGTEEQPSFQGDAILTRLPIRNVRVLRFKYQSSFWKPHAWVPDWPIFQRRLGGRIALIAELQLSNGGMLVVYNAHLESRSFGAIQTHQLEEILEDTRRYPQGTAIIIAGDLNTKYNPHTFLKKLEGAGFTNAFGERTPRTHIFVCALDWLTVRGPVRVEDAIVRRGVGASDHFPISADLAAAP